MTRWLAVAALVCGLNACSGQTRHPDPPTKSHASFADLLGAGNQLLIHRNPAAAAQVFQQAIAIAPHLPAGYYDLGVAQAEEGLRRDALADYAAAIKQDPKYVPALYNLGVAFTQTRPQVAMYFFRRAVALQPDSPTALLHLGLLTDRMPKLRSRALKALKRAVLLEPSLSADIPAGLRAVVSRTRLTKKGM